MCIRDRNKEPGTPEGNPRDAKKSAEGTVEARPDHLLRPATYSSTRKQVTARENRSSRPPIVVPDTPATKSVFGPLVCLL